ncbi:hypothetical protein ACVULX_003774 [Klebsiella pneumoniae]
MTDITELAQNLKAAAVRAKTATEEYASGHMSVSVCFAECEEFNRLTDGPDNILALVEALEKAQQRITQMESRTVTDWIEHDGKWRPESLGLDELVYLKTRKQELKIPYPAGKVKGWMHTGGDMDVIAYKLASPQASTVTVKQYDEFQICHYGATEDYAKGYIDCQNNFFKWLAAAGIKVEAE